MHRAKTTRRAFTVAGAVAIASAASRPGWRTLSAAAGALQETALTGRVIWPQDPAYAEARLGFNARFSRFPAAIVVCSRVEDVQNAVRWARQQGMPLRARSGGHSYEGFSVVDDGLVIDVSGLADVSVDAARGQAVVGAGVRLLDLYRRLWAFGVTVPGGTCPTVGIAGLTLGGGIGYLSRQYGLTCDNLLAVEMVDANGDVVRASEDEHADLFWALRGGGGGNFGIVTAFTFRIHPVAEVALCSAWWPWDDVAEVIDAWQHWAPFADERLSVGLSAPSPIEGRVTALGQFNGPVAELEALLTPLLAAGTPQGYQAWTAPFIAAVEQFAGPDAAQSRFKNVGAFADAPLTAEAIATFVDQMRASPSAANLVGFFPEGGATAAVDPAATAFVHRRALFNVQYQAYWSNEADEAADVAWVRAIRDAMAPAMTGTYVNYIDADLSDWATAYYGANLARLVSVKAKYDPESIFNGPQSIPVSGL